MTSAVRTSDSRRGFTLLEIVIVLALAAIIAGGAIGMMAYSSSERTLREVSGKVEVLAKRARMIAVLQQTPYALEFRPGEVHLMPFAEAMPSGDKQILSREKIPRAAPQPAEEDAEKKREPVYDSYTFPAEMAVSIRRWNTTGFILLERNVIQTWRFDPDGLCEPVSLHYQGDKGWAEDEYHPLTAAIRDSQLEVK